MPTKNVNKHFQNIIKIHSTRNMLITHNKEYGPTTVVHNWATYLSGFRLTPEQMDIGDHVINGKLFLHDHWTEEELHGLIIKKRNEIMLEKKQKKYEDFISQTPTKWPKLDEKVRVKLFDYGNYPKLVELLDYPGIYGNTRVSSSLDDREFNLKVIGITPGDNEVVFKKREYM